MRRPEATDWEAQPDGSIIFVCGTPGPAGYGLIKKFVVTPAPGSNLATWVASAKCSETELALIPAGSQTGTRNTSTRGSSNPAITALTRVSPDSRVSSVGRL